jgi:hypothetical protein
MGSLRRTLGLDDLLIKPGLLQRARVSELRRRPGALERTPGQLPLVELSTDDTSGREKGGPTELQLPGAWLDSRDDLTPNPTQHREPGNRQGDPFRAR